MTIRRMPVGLLCVCVTSLAWARTGTVSVEKVGETFNVTFANHAHETNGLWVVYGAADRGEGTNGWDHAELLQTVYPAARPPFTAARLFSVELPLVSPRVSPRRSICVRG